MNILPYSLLTLNPKPKNTQYADQGFDPPKLFFNHQAAQAGNTTMRAVSQSCPYKGPFKGDYVGLIPFKGIWGYTGGYIGICRVVGSGLRLFPESGVSF